MIRLRNAVPRQGTETMFVSSYNVFCLLRNAVPRQGTETKKWIIGTECPLLELRNAVPRQGTETVTGYYKKSNLSKLRNAVPRQGTETEYTYRYRYSVGLRNAVPRQGTETITWGVRSQE